MNASEFIHVASWLIQKSEQPIDADNLGQNMTDAFWPNTKIRNQRWKSTVNGLERELKNSDSINHHWLNFLGNAHEIILAESLTRIWFAVACSRNDSNDVRDIAADVIADNKQIKKRVLQILESVPTRVQHLVNQSFELQTLSDRVTDLMLSQLPNQEIARQFAVNPAAFDDFASCAVGYNDTVIRQANVALCLAFSDGIHKLASQISFNEDLNRKIVDNILDLFPATDKEFMSAHDNEPACI